MHTITKGFREGMFLSFKSNAMARCANVAIGQTSVLCTTVCSAALGAAIVSGEYQPGQVLTLDGVSAEHGLSRSVAREAIRVLESMGMVESRRRVGLTIRGADKWNVFDPRAHSVATRVRRPRCPVDVTFRATAWIRTGGGCPGRAEGRRTSVPPHGGGCLRHGRARTIRRPRSVLVGRQGLSPSDARSQR